MASHIERRKLLATLLGGAAAAWPLAARAQQTERVMRIGVLMAYAESDPEAQAWVAAFREGLQKLGWAEGRNIRIDTRWATADVESIQRVAKELVALQPELVVSTSTPSTAWLLQQTRTIPIIFTNVSDPVGSGFVASLPRPGGYMSQLLAERLLNWLSVVGLTCRGEAESGPTWHRMTSPGYIANSRKHTLISSRRKAKANSLRGKKSCTGHGPACSPIRISRNKSTKLPCLERTPGLALSPVKPRFNALPLSDATWGAANARRSCKVAGEATEFSSVRSSIRGIPVFKTEADHENKRGDILCFFSSAINSATGVVPR